MSFRPVVILALAALLAGGARALPAKGAGRLPPPRPPRLHIDADAYVTAASPRRNFGHLKALRFGSSPAMRVYLRSERVDKPLTQVMLYLWARSTLPRLEIRAVRSNWSESKITFSNAPRPVGPTIRMGRIPAGTKTGINVTRLVSGKRSVNLMLSAPAGSIGSRESVTNSRPVGVYSASWPALGAAGEVGDCSSPWDSQTATRLDNGGASGPRDIGTIAALGDLAYENGSLDDFNTCYQSSWGTLRSLTKPTPGDLEYQTTGAAGYFGYWGRRAGSPARSWYSYDIGSWHIISLNSNCRFVGGCQAGSPQERWLRKDLAAHKTRCTLAYWHHPRFSGGQVTNDDEMQPFWQALYDYKADVVLSAHAHNYQRFAPQSPTGVADPPRGIREFVVGTGGHHVLQPVAAIANTEAMHDSDWGVLVLTLRDTGYDWSFFPVVGSPGLFHDLGSEDCH
jgi:hypothetical protein